MTSYVGAGLQNMIPMLSGFGTIVQLLVLGSLLLASVICWAIILNKVRKFRRVQRYDRRFRRAFQSAQDFAFMAAAARRFSQAPMARLLRTAHQYAETSSNGASPGLSGQGLERLRQTLHARLAVETGELETGLPFLATTASASPFIGLLGTVWGIIQSFHAVGQGGSASLVVVGPGISEALVATAAGLAAAIPAVIAYNYFLNRLHRMESDLQGFIEELLQMFEAVPVATSEMPTAGSHVPLQH